MLQFNVRVLSAVGGQCLMKGTVNRDPETRRDVRSQTLSRSELVTSRATANRHLNGFFEDAWCRFVEVVYVDYILR